MHVGATEDLLEAGCSSSVSCGAVSMSRFHVHILPSVETVTKLCAFCVPTMSMQYTGCVCEDAA